MDKVNKAKPTVTITLDRERVLCYDLNAMCEFERVTGRDVFVDGAYSSTSAADMRVMLWACLLKDDPAITLEQVGALISIDNMVEIAFKLNEVFEAATPAKQRKSGRPLPSRSG